MGLKQPPRIIEPYTATDPIKQPHPQHILQLAKAARYGRLCDVQTGCCQRHALCAGDFKKGSDMPKPQLIVQIHNQ